jgi:hypothetical protein
MPKARGVGSLPGLQTRTGLPVEILEPATHRRPQARIRIPTRPDLGEWWAEYWELRGTGLAHAFWGIGTERIRRMNLREQMAKPIPLPAPENTTRGDQTRPLVPGTRLRGGRRR